MTAHRHNPPAWLGKFTVYRGVREKKPNFKITKKIFVFCVRGMFLFGNFVSELVVLLTGNDLKLADQLRYIFFASAMVTFGPFDIDSRPADLGAHRRNGPRGRSGRTLGIRH